MGPAQSIALLLAIIGVCFAPAALWWARRKDAADGQAQLRGCARTLYGEAHGWNREDLEAYDAFPSVRQPWIGAARDRLRK